MNLFVTKLTSINEEVASVIALGVHVLAEIADERFDNRLRYTSNSRHRVLHSLFAKGADGVYYLFAWRRYHTLSPPPFP